MPKNHKTHASWPARGYSSWIFIETYFSLESSRRFQKDLFPRWKQSGVQFVKVMLTLVELVVTQGWLLLPIGEHPDRQNTRHLSSKSNKSRLLINTIFLPVYVHKCPKVWKNIKELNKKTGKNSGLELSWQFEDVFISYYLYV